MESWQLDLLKTAKTGNEEAREKLIESYTSFIKQAASNYCKRKLEWENDDELSIAMLAFNEAIDSYDLNSEKKFENYVRMVMKNRLIDFYRKESRHNNLSLENNNEEGIDNSTNSKQHSQDTSYLEAKVSLERYREKKAVENRKEEMEEFEKELNKFGLSLEMLEKSAPKHEKTRNKLVEIAQYIASQSDLSGYVKKKKKLPLKEVVLATGISKKVLKRGRQYILGIMLIMMDERFSYLRSLFTLPLIGKDNNEHNIRSFYSRGESAASKGDGQGE
ncbi:RNA polymerase sigma-I factor [Natranaerofaba carboxydovora]|uniref:RNA polymerase sigma-I factor n=1 Tax=Natranaerofaba carboxydovora TaxID=2742683 RepID=UPI001F12B8C1|nr:RNA polymerase sigma-I factor [Natranaerofaba carboxydovora]UMZ72505.1 RNA polymerase sigma factor SigI [Natranaerofaba carboxydovora]